MDDVVKRCEHAADFARSTDAADGRGDRPGEREEVARLYEGDLSFAHFFPSMIHYYHILCVSFRIVVPPVHILLHNSSYSAGGAAAAEELDGPHSDLLGPPRTEGAGGGPRIAQRAAARDRHRRRIRDPQNWPAEAQRLPPEFDSATHSFYLFFVSCHE